MSVADLRKEYARSGLREEDVDRNPFIQFKHWFEAAMRLSEPNAMTLATTGSNGQPSARIVLLKGYDEQGFVFYSNYHSQKGQHLSQNPHAALLFWWPSLERQVRIEGRVERVTEAESDAYFAVRPRGSQLGAWVSEQSRRIESRSVLESRLAELEGRYPGDDVPRPPHWGGYRVIPSRIEFWQGRPNRLHDRLLYTCEESGEWRLSRLAP